MIDYNQKKFLIVGGGTAGWITALYLNKIFPKNKITLIESSEIGILGAGEGTTPHFVDFLEKVGINFSDFIKNTKATIKTGIKFTNWHGDNTSYFHPFADGDSLSIGSGWIEKKDLFAIDRIAHGKNLDDIILSNLCSVQNKTKHRYDESNDLFLTPGAIALHFDARLVANYFKEVATNRGVVRIDSKVTKFNLDDENLNITSVELEDKQNVFCDFIFDCTGFSRKIIGEIYKQKWIDYKESLPVDKAFPFFLENKTETIPPYTEAIAMKYGWVWKIPVQGRYGCGYVFDSSYVSDDDIRKEIQETFGEVEIPRNFSFKAGFYENAWMKNCVAIGLSSGFIEPLEATSIWVSLRSLTLLLRDYQTAIFDDDENVKMLFNEHIRSFNNEIKDFIQLHYLTERNDSPFWKEYRIKNKIVNSISEMENAKCLHESIRLNYKHFQNFHPYYVFAGVKFYNTNMFKKYFDLALSYPINKNYNEELEKFISELNFFADFKATDHYKFLKQICK